MARLLRLHSIDVEEVSLVDHGAIDSDFTERKRAVPFKAYPLAPKGREWDAAAAEQRVRVWAGAASPTDIEGLDFGVYRRAFAWFDDTAPENVASYKLLHHDVIDGQIHTVFRGVQDAIAGIDAASIPADQLAATRAHLDEHLAEFEEAEEGMRAQGKAWLGEQVKRALAAGKISAEVIAEKTGIKTKAPKELDVQACDPQQLAALAKVLGFTGADKVIPKKGEKDMNEEAIKALVAELLKPQSEAVKALQESVTALQAKLDKGTEDGAKGAVTEEIKTALDGAEKAMKALEGRLEEIEKAVKGKTQKKGGQEDPPEGKKVRWPSFQKYAQPVAKA